MTKIEILNDKKINKDKVSHLLKKCGRHVNVYDSFLNNLFEIRNPSLYKKVDPESLKRFKEEILNDENNPGNWVYYPWLNDIFLLPPENIFLEVFTARNKPLIPDSEQQDFYKFNVGIVGLSVGQSTALTLVRTGGCKNIKIADPDTIEPSNLNRIHFGIPEIGQKKNEVVAKRILEINPYSNIQIFDDGVNENNINDFFLKGFKLNAIVDACDDFPTKILIREYARKNKIPLLMATDIGDGTLLDIERYDLNPDLEIFGGRLKLIKKDDDFMSMALKIISPEYVPMALLESLSEIGSSIPTHPQLATSVFFSGVLLSYAIRRIANKKDIIDKRHYIEFEEYLDPRYQDEKFIKYRDNKKTELRKYLGLED